MSTFGDLAKYGIVPDGAGGMRINGHLVAHGGFSGSMGKGRVFFVDASRTSSGNGRTPNTAFKTIAEGEAALTANRNDTLVYLQSNSSASIVDTLTWDKDYTHFLGVCAPTRVAQRARIFNSGNTTASTALLAITAKGCSFQNFYIFQGSAVATVGCVEVTGGRNYFHNVHIAAPGHATMAGGANAYALKMNGAEENYFEDCTIGVDTIKRTADNKILWFDGDCKRNIFRDCRFISHAEVNTYAIVKVQDSGSLDRYMIFDGCFFYNFWTNHGDKLLEVFDLPGSMATNDIVLKNCLAVGADEWDDSDAANMWVDNLNGAATTGIGLAPAL